MRSFKTLALVLALATLHSAYAGVKFEISLKPELATNALEGRLVLLISTTNRMEPRIALEDADATGPLAFGVDVKDFTSRNPVIIDETATATLDASLDKLLIGHYFIQAVLDISTDARSINAGGNPMSDVLEMDYTAHTRSPIKLEISRRIFDERESDHPLVKYVKIPSRLLSDFHHRPMFLRAGVVLPRTFADDPNRRFPVWMHIGGFGGRYARVASMMAEKSAFRAIWLATNAPQMIYVLPDGAGPNGDPYQVNSANNGPYGDAITQELIPYIEKEFRGIGEPRGRVLSGRSTGGWSSLALQIFYPDFFNGAWAASPDPVDFRQFELVNIYEDKNAYVNEHGEERPSAREANGDVRLLMRREVQMENVLGRDGQWWRSSGQWGAWNAVFGPRASNGLPIPLWDAKGKINPSIAAQWTKYDLRIVLEKNWDTLAPKLRGKLHIWAAEADDYFLNNAVHLLEHAVHDREPKDVITFTYGPGEVHGWMSITVQQMMEQMYARTQQK